MANVGDIIGGKYRLRSVLGEGGMGAVYAAEHTLLGKRVAIKVLRKQFAKKEEAVRRFYREAQAAASCGHRGIVEVHDFGWTEDRLPFLVMELLEGETLAKSCWSGWGAGCP